MIQNQRLEQTLYLFDQDLRLDDNPALEYAASGARDLLCVYVHDQSRREPDSFGSRRLGRIRRRFIDQCLAQLSSDLNRQGQILLQVSGPPVRLLGELIDEHGIRRVVRSRNFGYFERLQWQQLKRDHPLTDFFEIDNYTLFTWEQIAGIGELPETFSRFRRRVENMSIAPPLEPGPLPPPPNDLEKDSADAEIAASSGSQFVGGEGAAAAHVEAYFEGQSPLSYKQTRNELDGWTNSSKMSPWLAAGCLSARRLHRRLKDYEASNGGNESTYWLYFELLWREYFQWYALQHSAKLFLPAGISGGNAVYAFDESRFDLWCKGETDWPLVNACMRQLNQTGYLSNRARQIVASVLVNELELDWRCGAGYFEQQLIDYDVASNWGNWQYIAGVGADPRGGRHFSIDKQVQQFDASGSFVAKWLNTHQRGDSDRAAPVAAD